MPENPGGSQSGGRWGPRLGIARRNPPWVVRVLAFAFLAVSIVIAAEALLAFVATLAGASSYHFVFLGISLFASGGPPFLDSLAWLAMVAAIALSIALIARGLWNGRFAAWGLTAFGAWVLLLGATASLLLLLAQGGAGASSVILPGLAAVAAVGVLISLARPVVRAWFGLERVVAAPLRSWAPRLAPLVIAAGLLLSPLVAAEVGDGMVPPTDGAWESRAVTWSFLATFPHEGMGLVGGEQCSSVDACNLSTQRMDLARGASCTWEGELWLSTGPDTFPVGLNVRDGGLYIVSNQGDGQQHPNGTTGRNYSWVNVSNDGVNVPLSDFWPGGTWWKAIPEKVHAAFPLPCDTYRMDIHFTLGGTEVGTGSSASVSGTAPVLLDPSRSCLTAFLPSVRNWTYETPCGPPSS
ncbi:MAG: hypothetical protein ACYDDF_03235 [Thermoplasmatota archaeon]